MSNVLGQMKTVQSVFAAGNAVEGLSTHVADSGAFRVEGMPVFRSGTFKDSMGYQQTWEPEHLEQMVFNFNMLRDRGTLPNVPVRDGHRSFLGTGGQVIGYITKLTHDQSAGRLLADYEITEPEAAAKIQRGTFRARSAEVGMYETNDEATYWPVFVGFAFVDIPAVEGLYNKKIEDGEYVLFTQNIKETTVTAPVTQKSGGGRQPAQGSPATPPDAPEVDGQRPGASGSSPTGGEPAAPVAATAQVDAANHGAAQPGAFTFTVGGKPINDFAAVQRHITTLETAASEQRDAGRKAFVSGLAGSNKITQPQVESLTALALSMDDEQFGQFRAAYDAAPTQPLLAVHGAPGTPGGTPKGTEDANDELNILRETIAQHSRAGVSQAQIEKMPSFIRLRALEASTPKE